MFAERVLNLEDFLNGFEKIHIIYHQHIVRCVFGFKLKYLQRIHYVTVRKEHHPVESRSSDFVVGIKTIDRNEKFSVS